ncbi:outer membrane protein assembly factor BamB family protein [Haloterrigena gelatinilytica]|nr:PQQ-binding-like beta-propeller repeat protein [Haloterrigena gelatinilytica]
MARFSANNGMVTDEWSGPDGPLEERWTVETDNKVAGPVIGNGLVYIADESSKFYAIDVISGETAWTFDAEESVPTTPAVTDDTVYFLTETLYAIDSANGDQLWSIELGSSGAGDIRISDETVYIHNAGTLYAVSITEKSIVLERGADSTQDIAIGNDGTFYAVRRTNNEADYEVIAVNVTDRETKWTYSPSGNVSSGFGLLVHDGTIYLNEMERVLTINGETGEAETLTEYEKTSETVPTTGRAPTLGNGILYSPAPIGYPAVHAVELEVKGEPSAWNSDALEGGPTGFPPFISKDTLYVWRGYGYVDINAINPETGKQRWSFDVRDHQDMARGMVQGYAILEDSIIYSIDGNYSVIGALETA